MMLMIAVLLKSITNMPNIALRETITAKIVAEKTNIVLITETHFFFGQ
jgi:hypothetical protein